MTVIRGLATLVAGAVVATTVSIAPAQAARGWETALTWQGARAQVCAQVHPDGTATVRVRMNNVRGEAKVSAGIASVRGNGRPDRTLVTTKYVGAGKISSVVEHDELPADGLFYVDIAHMTDEGAGVVKTSAKPFVVSAQTAC
ncbi:hypothetical protein [Nocardioides sp. SYSU D00065]|uniref:hypothetical protein n=1 Tax=Nocardioides sp. SYSU D00065 TaxID=2817378 RepID=UPI001B3198E1|nr:hypothetical protein [Nocardioides sp. SYSU D00065]